MTISYQTDEISLFPLKKDLQGYTRESFRSDALAAISVACLTVPQAMAYALLAGLPISCGIFAAIYSALIATMFGSCRHLIIGPSNAIAVLVQFGISETLFSNYRDIAPAEREVVVLQLLIQLGLLVGLMQILGAAFKLGRLTQFVSHSVVIGYIVGTAIAVVINQSFTLLGIPRLVGVYSLYDRAVYFISHFDQIQLPTAFIGLFTLAVIIGLKKISKRLPAALIGLSVSALLVYALGIASNYSLWPVFDAFREESLQPILLVKDSGILTDIIPSLTMPFLDFHDMNALLPVAFAIALLSVMETSSAAKSIAASSGQRLFINQEVLSLGIGNFVSSLIAGMPISGSPSRSTLNFLSGAQTRISAILNSVFVLLILLIFSHFITLIPLAALAALLLVTAVTVVNSQQFLLCLKATRSDAMVLAVTIVSCLFFSFDIAFYIGVGMSITLYLKKASIPQLVEFEVDESGEITNIDYCEIHNHRSIRVIKVEGELFFGAADLFQSTLKAIAEDDTHTKVIILQLKNARDIDATTCLALQQLNDYLKSSGRYLIACGLTQQIWDVLNDSGLIDKLGKDNLFVFDERNPHYFMQKALQRAKALKLLARPVPFGHSETPPDLSQVVVPVS